MPQLAAQQPDLPRMNHLMLGAPQQRPQFRFRQRVRLQDGLVQFLFVKPPQLLKHLLMHSIEGSPDFSLARILGGIGGWRRFPCERAEEILGDQSGILWLRPTDALQSEPVLGHRQMADLPSDMAHTARRLPEPFRYGCPIEKANGVAAGRCDLFDGQL